MNKKYDTVQTILYIVLILTIVYVLVDIFKTNISTNTEWNNGICIECNVRYELIDISTFNKLKLYKCPKCGNEIKRY